MQAAQDADAVEFRQDEVEEYRIGGVGIDARERLLSVLRLDDTVAAVTELRLELHAHEARIVNDEKFHRAPPLQAVPPHRRRRAIARLGS